jgi:hypothetical protein
MPTTTTTTNTSASTNPSNLNQQFANMSVSNGIHTTQVINFLLWRFFWSSWSFGINIFREAY